jgi:hypothetical protein
VSAPFADPVLVDAPTAVARALVREGAADYATTTRDALTVIAAAITVVGATSDIISLASSREAIAGFLRRLRSWGEEDDRRSELTLRLDDRVDVRLSTRGPHSEEELLVLADRIIEALRPTA